MAVELPNSKRPVSSDLGGQSILIYGPPGVGKTTWANSFPDTLFLAPEDGQRSIECYVVPISSWGDFKEAYLALKGKEGKRYKTIAIDTIDVLWNYCTEYVGKKHGFDHPSDEDWGKGYQLIRDEFQRGINRLCSLGKGIVLISHSVDREVKTRVLTITKTMPTLPKSARSVIIPMVSVIVYAGFKTVKDKETGELKERRVAITQPSETLEAKDRTGRLPASMPLNGKKFMEFYRTGKSE